MPDSSPVLYPETIHDPAAVRSRTVTWQNPALGLVCARDMSGLDWLNEMFQGRLPRPPLNNLLGVDEGGAEPGRVWMGFPAGEHLYNPMCTVHGGVLSTVLDSAMGCAVQSTLGPGESYTTIDLHVTFVRAVTAASGRLRCEGEVVHAGRRLATAQARLLDAQGRLCAHAVSSCMIRRAGDANGRD
jgi:uncharacterized protein (TIGR00369 family)